MVQNGADSGSPGTWTFMPQMLAIGVRGRITTLNAVSTRRTSLTRWERTDSFVTSMGPGRAGAYTDDWIENLSAATCTALIRSTRSRRTSVWLWRSARWRRGRSLVELPQLSIQPLSFHQASALELV